VWHAARTAIEYDYNRIAKVDHPKLDELWELSPGEIDSEGSRAARSTLAWPGGGFISIYIPKAVSLLSGAL